jgi:ribose transport system substrate-binding protein
MLRNIRTVRRRIALPALILAVAVALAACGSSSSSSSSSGGASSSQAASTSSGGGSAKGKYVIALSNSFLGNTWRQTMVRIFENTAKQAQSQGLISGYKVENVADNTATEQVAQLKSLILQHVNAILIDAASPDALNPTIQQACSAGITVVVFDSLATAPCAYKLEDSIASYGYQEGHFVGEKMGGKGNVLMVRGVVGSAPEKVIYDNQLKALKAYPAIKIVDTLVGQASNSITQQAVAGALPSLPPVQGVITGGSSLGVVQAFMAAHKPIPVVAFDNSGEALRFWQAQHQKNGYTAVSVRTEPGQAAAAFWMALDILQGKKIPNMIYTFPNVVITQADLSKWLAVTPNGAVAAYAWTRAETEQALTANQNHQTAATPPIPTSPPGGA